MSRAINTSLATIQFQVNARQANAAMQALQEASNDLNRAIDSVNRNIANLGKDVPKDNPQLLNYQSQLAGLKKDLKDVEKAQRDFLKGAKAADQLWKAASEGTIESLSFRSIKTGINGLKKRQEGLSPGDAQDMKDWRIIKDVIDEADRVVKQSGADVQNVVQTIREGGKVSEQTMRQTISTLKELKGSVDETDADFRTYGNDLDFMEAKLQEFSDAQRRAKGEIVDANDARREMNKLTAEGAAAAQREAEAAERKIAALHGEREELMAQREQIKQNIAATQEQIDKNHELIEEKHRQLAADERAHNVIQDANHAHIEGLKTQAEAERKLANEKSDAAETHRRAAELQKQTTEQLTEKVAELQGKLAALNAEPVKPKVDTSEIDGLKAKLEEIRSRRSQIESARTLLNDQMETLTGKGSRRGSSVLFKDYENGIFHKDQLKVYIDQLNAAYKKIGPQKENETFQAYYERLGKEAFPDMKGVLSQFRDWEHLIRSICSQVTDLSGELKAIPNMSGAGPSKRFDGFDLQKGYTTARQDANKLKKDNEELLSEYTDLGTKEFDIEQQIIDAKKQSTTATKNEVEATKQESQELEQIEWKLKNIDNLRKEQQKIIDDYEAKYGKTSDEQYEARRKIELDASRKDVAAQETAVEKVNKKWDDFWKKQEAAAQEFARSLGKSLDEIAPEDITSEHLSGPLAKSAQAAYKVTARRDYEFSEALGREGKLTEYKETARRYEGDDSPEAKVIESLTRKYREYVKELNEATTSNAEAKKVQAELREESDAYISALAQMQGFQKVENDLLQQKDSILKQTAETSKQSAETQEQSNEKSEEELRLKGELEEAQGKLAESKKRENEEQQEYVKLQGEAIEQGNKAAAAETKLADAQSEATQKQAEFNQKQQEGLDAINQMAEGNKALQTTLEGQEQQLKDNSDAVRKNAEETTAAEQEKAQTRQLSIKRMEEMLAKLKEEYYTEELTAEKREEHKQKIKELDEALRLAKGEWMSYGDAMKYASSIGSEGFMATDEQTKMATDALTRHREELIKTIQQKEADSQATSAERAELEQLDQALTKIKTGFASADEVMTRWAEHMNAGKTASEGVAQTLDEKLAGATSSWDAKIAAETSYLEDCNKELDRYEQELQELSEELKELEQKHSNRSWLWKKTHARQYQREESRIEWLREDTTSGNTFDEEGNIKRATTKGLVDDMRYYKQDAQERLAQLKQLKAEELGLTESEVEAEEKKADAKKLTNEQMQEGIKLLEEEYAKTEHTTEEGIKKRQQLRETIDQMNQELKESTGEWMKLADAEKLAEQAGKDTFLNKEGKGFIASPEEIQKATQALERRRDALIKNMKTSGEATKEQERELTDLTKKIKDLKFEQDNLNMSQEKMQMLMRTPTNAVSLDELRAAIKRADGELKRMEGSLGQNNAQYKAFAEQVRNAKNQLKEMEGQAKATSTAWEKAWSRLKTYVVMYMGFNAVWQKVVGTADDLMDLSDKMGEVRKTTGFTADEVGRLSDELKKLDTRTTITGLLDLSVAAGQLGLKTQEDVEGFTIAANKLMVALPEMGKEGATEMLKVALATGEIDKIRKQMEQGLIDGSSATAVAMEKVGSTIDRLRATSAATAPAITDFVKRVGAVGAQSGISIDQVAALGSTVDALGMRVEMSATALSRMIPAIKNNAFAVAKAIGVTPETLRSLFEAGKGMEAILLIFQHIKDAGMGEDDIEKMLGMGGMKEVMKELNQQGARAGIVFAGLSQNVDVLRQHLGTAAQAYEENIAIQQEYDKMNETTAAKWERLKNEFEEFFVGDFSQRFLGVIIDTLRLLVNFLTGNVNPALQLVTISLRTFLVYWATLKVGLGEALFVKATSGLSAMGAQLKNLISDTRKYRKYTILLGRAQGEQAKKAVAARMAQEGLNKAMIANVWMAVIMAIGAAALTLYNWVKEVHAAAKEAAKFQNELMKEQMKVDNLTESIGKAKAKTEDANKEVEKSKKNLDAVKKSTDGTKESTDKLTKAESDLIEKEEIRNKAMSEHKRLIEQFNSEYGKYLGFMLSEVSSNIELANARQLVNDKLRETITLKRKEAAISRIEENMGEDRDDAYASLWSAVRYSATSKNNNGKSIQDPTKAAKVMNALTKAAMDASNDRKSFENAVKKILQENKVAYRGNSVLSDALSYYDEVAKIRKKTVEIEQQFTAEESANREQSQKDLKQQYSAATKNYDDLQKKYETATGKAKQQAAANLLRQQDTINEMVNNAGTYFDTADANEKAGYDKFIKNSEKRMTAMSEARGKLLKEAGSAYTSRKTVGGGTTSSIKDNPWGNALSAESTDWKNMTAEQLVNRRKQMKDFVNAIQTDSDVKRVLGEDAALKKAIENGMSSDMRTVIEWYNTERLKIQDELHARHLTNTGDWRDPKKERGAKKQFRDEMDAYLHELDAYYTERKTRIEEAGTDEGLTEAEIRNRTLNNEMEWQQRRAELQKLYSRKQKEVTQEELDAIYHIIAERTDDSEAFVKAQIAKTNQFVDSIEKSGEKGAAIVHRWMSQVELDTERSYLKGQQALTKQMRAIEAIIDKERPFNGITKSLQESLSTMDILTGEMRKEYNELMKQGKDMTDFNNRQAQEEMKRTAFLLGEAENAYSTNIDRVMDDMRQKGMTAWADWLSADPKLQEALMAQLRSTYDAIQDAIKKEASQLKKQAEIMWNNILMPDGKTTLKQQTDRVIAQLGLDEDRVKRANSLIGAGQASERVADKLAIQQMKVQLAMQEHYYNLMRKRGKATVENLEREAEAAKKLDNMQEYEQKMLDAKHARMSLNLATAKEETELAKQREDIIARTEESQNRLYTELKSWADLLTSSLQGVMEASHAGDKEYYNERAKLDLTGRGGPGAGMYIVIEDEGTSDATAHYEYLDERAALERQREIENQNAVADARKKMWDDLNQKMSDTITDQLNAMLQNKATEDNTAELQNLQQKLQDEQTKLDASVTATDANTQAVQGLTQQLAQGIAIKKDGETGSNAPGTDDVSDFAYGKQNYAGGAPAETLPSGGTDAVSDFAYGKQNYADGGEISPAAQQQIADQNAVTENFISNKQKEVKTEQQADKKMATGSQSMFAKMTQAANLYGIAYQAMSNDNLDTAQKFQMIALQAVGNAAIAGLTTAISEATAKTAVNTAVTASKDTAEHGSILGPILTALSTAVLGGLIGLATSKVAKSKAQISQVTGASINAGRMATGMLTYAEGNVNEFSDPASLTPGKHYNVDGADGKTYRAKYTGTNPKTHITNGPEFHLVGEAGREAIIDAHTTRNIQLNEPEIWRSIQTLYNGGSLRHTATRRGRGVRAFADGNLDDFEDVMSGSADSGMDFGSDMLAGLQSSLDRNSEVLERALREGFRGVFDVYGKGGLVDSYDTGKKTVQRHGERY